MNVETLKQRRLELINSIENDSVIILFSGKAPYRSADELYPFVTNRNFYYLTGLDRENFILMITKQNDKAEECLFIEEPNPQIEKWIGKKIRKAEASKISGINNIQFINGFKDSFNRMLLRLYLENIYLDMERQDWNAEDTIGIKFANELINKYPHVKIKNIYPNISQMRLIKNKEEIGNLKKAIDITNDGIINILKNLKPGMNEYQIEAYFDFTLKMLGAKEHAFKTIAASGENGAILHYSSNNCEIKENSLILFDLGAAYENYCADISRTFPASGKFTKRQKQIYNIVLKAQLETIKAAKPGITLKELNDVTVKVLTDECKKLGLIKEDKELSKYYYHSVSHFLGLDAHDVGDYRKGIEKGMVITVEPGLYIEAEGRGIRIEDDIMITEDGCENLSKNIIKTVDDIEEFMSKNNIQFI